MPDAPEPNTYLASMIRRLEDAGYVVTKPGQKQKREKPAPASFHGRPAPSYGTTTTLRAVDHELDAAIIASATRG